MELQAVGEYLDELAEAFSHVAAVAHAEHAPVVVSVEAFVKHLVGARDALAEMQKHLVKVTP
jgi:hypothetical protein